MKNAETLENMANIDTIIFDKTGTITSSDKSTLVYKGERLTISELAALKVILRASNHPLSRSLYDFIETEPLFDKTFYFAEILGRIWMCN